MLVAVFFYSRCYFLLDVVLSGAGFSLSIFRTAIATSLGTATALLIANFGPVGSVFSRLVWIGRFLLAADDGWLKEEWMVADNRSRW